MPKRKNKLKRVANYGGVSDWENAATTQTNDPLQKAKTAKAELIAIEDRFESRETEITNNERLSRIGKREELAELVAQLLPSLDVHRDTLAQIASNRDHEAANAPKTDPLVSLAANSSRSRRTCCYSAKSTKYVVETSLY